MKWLIRSFLVLLVLALGAVGWWLFAAHRGDASLAQTGQLTAGENLSDPALIERGKYLATVGDCAACHTQRGGVFFAGGHEVPTPFGNIPMPNITPDDETGLGRWSFADFWQALHFIHTALSLMRGMVARAVST